MKRMIRILPFVLLTLFMGGNLYADSLGDLFGGGSIVAGDKLFDSWQLISYDSSDATRSFDAFNIEVTPLDDGGLNPGPGLQFDVLNNELTVIGDGILAYVDLTFAFRVSVLDSNMAITGSSLEFLPGGAFLGWTVDDSYDLGNYIFETVGSEAGLSDLGTEEIEFSVSKLPGTTEDFLVEISDSLTFASQNEIWITKNIYVWAADATDTAGTYRFGQRFAQTAVPEPSTLLLIGLGVAGLAFLRASRKL